MANNSDKTFRDLLNSGQAQILGIVSIVPMGDWNGTKTYQKLNYVRHNGATYLAKVANNNVEPGVAQNWQDVWMLGNYDGGLVVPDGTYPNLTAGRVVNALMWGSKSYDGSSPQTITAEDLGLANVYKLQGSIAFSALPNTPSADTYGYVWNITNDFTTDSRFIEGAGKQYFAGANVGVIEQNGTYYYDVLGNFIDTSTFVQIIQQTFTAEQQAQARANIGAFASSGGTISGDFIVNGATTLSELGVTGGTVLNGFTSNGSSLFNSGFLANGDVGFAGNVEFSNGLAAEGNVSVTGAIYENGERVYSPDNPPPSQDVAKKVENALTVTVNDATTEYDGSAAKTVTVSASNPNLLYNSNFAINQRGNSSYSTLGYTLDGWQKTSSSGYVYIKTGAYAPMNQAIYFSAYSGVYIRQFLEIDLKPFTYYTVSIAYSTSSTATSPTEISYSFYCSQTSSQSFTWTPISGYQVYIYKPSYSSSSHSHVRIGRTSSSASTIYIFWIKLEEGRKATPYEIPNPATELLKCQRYYVRFTQDQQICGSVASAGNNGYVTMWLPVTMRVSPTIVSYSCGSIRIDGGSRDDVTSLEIASGDSSYGTTWENTKLYLHWTTRGTYDNFQPCSLLLENIELSAELTS